MKKIIVLLCFIGLFTSCKNDSKTTDSEITEVSVGGSEISAEFIYIQDAAVLKGQSFIYGVVLDEKAKELAEKVKSFKKDQYDMVPVVVNGIIKPNPVSDGWKEVVEIKEIVKVLPIRAVSYTHLTLPTKA